MIDDAFRESLFAAASDVLETMFFSSVVGDAEASATPPDGSVAARVQFSGARAGAFAIRLTEDAARTVAASFLAEDTTELSPAQIAEVVSELANMMCGSVLSRLDRGAHFDLGPPAIVDPASLSPGAVFRAFDIGDGEVAVFFQMEGQQ